MVYFDAAHLQKLVKDGQWEAAGTYLKGFSPLWEGEGTTQHYTSFLHNVQHRAMLAFLACRGEEGGRAASSLFWSNDDAFRKKVPQDCGAHRPVSLHGLCTSQGIRELGGHKAQNLGGTAGVASSSS